MNMANVEIALEIMGKGMGGICRCPYPVSGWLN